MAEGPAGGLDRIRHLHLVGVGGAGMSALAKLLAQSGLEVSGSDLRDGIELATLADLGVTTWAGHRPDLISGRGGGAGKEVPHLSPPDLVVASSAVPERDPELEAARRAGIPVWRRPDLLEALTATIPTIGATGTHGKTTTTALLVLGARAAGLDPSFVVGGELIDLGTNAHRGEDPRLILESDEAFGTFERIHLVGLVVTNVEPEHLDYFESVERMEATFDRVADGVAGPVVCCVDDPGSERVRQHAGAIGYGFGSGAAWRLSNLQERPGSVRFSLNGPGAEVEASVPRPGRHVALNAAGAIALLGELGFDPALTAAGMAKFAGVRRRFEPRGIVAGVTIVDDYAHHPTEVAATLAAARRGGHRRLWAVFQPHLYSRTALLHREMGAALAAADRVVVTDVYAARESPIPGITGELVANAARDSGAEVTYLPHRADLAAHLASLVVPGDLVLTLGAGDVSLVPTELAVLLAQAD
ncbi:MAG TPA: UDP-N-acetylmuramate--L-alanine ligase [Acidimicrobiia bacterium]|nr:UDP-N-acetylmuramate--L-alanine ligase [Acidimicrobiia bacterium]